MHACMYEHACMHARTHLRLRAFPRGPALIGNSVLPACCLICAPGLNFGGPGGPGGGGASGDAAGGNGRNSKLRPVDDDDDIPDEDKMEL